ncbi:MAG: GNAT family N-acetyltransferase [Porticoccaceae bacterium]|nr:GNAT family N-acetyltransferase [Porticoccaceae bacterium]
MHIRPATADDASHLAQLINLAGEGLPAYLWLADCGDLAQVMNHGAERARRESGGFSYRNAHILTLNGETAGMLLSYPLPSPYDAGNLADYPAVIRPIIELESLVPGTYYLNAIAVYAPFEGRGGGRLLMATAEHLARELNHSHLSLIVASENKRARQLYTRLDYREAARRRAEPFPGTLHEGDWLLMIKDL